MRLASIITAAAPLALHALPGVAQAAALERRQPGNGLPGSYVFRGDGRYPAEIRVDGGLRPQGGDYHNDDEAFSTARHFYAGPNGCGLDDFDTPGFVFRTAYVSLAHELEVAETYGDWLYEARATPNILDEGYPESEVFALGGIHWRQIRRYRQLRDLRGNATPNSGWIDNPEYDAATYNNPQLAPLCYVTTDVPHELQGWDEDDDGVSDTSEADDDRFQAAMEFMDNLEMDALVGDFPFEWRRYDTPANPAAVPGRPLEMQPPAVDAGEDEGEPPGVRVGVRVRAAQLTVQRPGMHLLAHYLSMGPVLLDQMFPRAHEVVEELARDVQRQGACALPHFYSTRALGPRGGMFSPHDHGRHHGPPPGALADASPAPAKDGHGCCRAAANLRKALISGPGMLYNACTHFDALEFYIRLGNWDYQGTWDSLIADFGNGSKHTIVSSPDPGFEAWQRIDLQQTFGEATVPVARLQSIGIIQMHDATFGNDRWFLRSIQLEGRCAGSLTRRALYKFNNINDSPDASNAAWGKGETVWSGKIEPRDDWRTPILCDAFSKLQVDFTMSNAVDAGTWDDLYLRFGSEDPDRDVLIAEKPSHGDSFSREVSLRRVFGKSPVPVREIRYFNVHSHAHMPGWDADWWKMGGESEPNGATRRR